MYIVVRESDNRIVASSTSLVSDRDGYVVYEIDDADYTPEIVGSVLGSFLVLSSSDDNA